MKIKKAIDKVILEDIEELDYETVGSDTRKALIDEVMKLTERRNEMNKNFGNRVQEVARTVVSMAGIIIPAIVTIWGTIEVLQFEEEGTITSNAGRGFMSRLIPRG